MSSELSLTEAEKQEVVNGLVKAFEKECYRLMRLADVKRKYGIAEQADQLEREVEMMDRQIHTLRTGEVLDGA